ncbi:hypothetical protein HDU67_009390 [Dinochytrium kinnereticum]|nr:hypothetical protein HDU67_009390 [Dinochytrium kinnereticum]
MRLTDLAAAAAAIVVGVVIGGGEAKKNAHHAVAGAYNAPPPAVDPAAPVYGAPIPAPPSPPMYNSAPVYAPPMQNPPGGYAPPSPPMNPPMYAPKPPMNSTPKPPMNTPPMYAPAPPMTHPGQKTFVGKYVTMTCPQNQPGYTLSAPPLCITSSKAGVPSCPTGVVTTTATTTITEDVTKTSQVTVTVTQSSLLIKIRKCTRVGGGIKTPTPPVVTTPFITSSKAAVPSCPPAIPVTVTSTTTKSEDVFTTSFVTVTAPVTQTVTQTVDAPCETIFVCPTLAPVTTTSMITQTVDMTTTAVVTVTATSTSIVKQMRKCTQKRGGGWATPTPVPTPGGKITNNVGPAPGVVPASSVKLFTGKFVTMTCPQNAPSYTISTPPLCVKPTQVAAAVQQRLPVVAPGVAAPVPAGGQPSIYSGGIMGKKAGVPLGELFGEEEEDLDDGAVEDDEA